MATELLIELRLNWSGPGHYDPAQALPCKACEEPTKERDGHGRALHQRCAQDAIVRQLMQLGWFLVADQRYAAEPAGRKPQGLLAERYGFSAADLAAELLGPPSAVDLHGRPAVERGLPR